MSDIQQLLTFFKTLSDESRLKIIGLIVQREYNARALAEELQLSEPTVSHHLLKLREAGLVNLRTEGNNHFYRLDVGRLNHLKSLTQKLETLPFDSPDTPQDTAWIEALQIEDWEKEVLRHYTLHGRIRRIPTKDKKWLVLLRWIVSQLEMDTQYTEAQMNEFLKGYHEDYALIRRDLIEFGFMGREKDGSIYWLKQSIKM